MTAKSDRSLGGLNVNRLKANPCSLGMVLWADTTLGLNNLVVFLDDSMPGRRCI